MPNLVSPSRLSDVGVKPVSFDEYQQEARRRGLAEALQQAQIMQQQVAMQKTMQPDIEDLGKRAFMKAATGQQISAEEGAALQYLDSKSQNYGFNPQTGRIEAKPSLLDRAGIGGITPPSRNMPPTKARNMPIVPGGNPQTIPEPLSPEARAGIVELYGDDGKPVGTTGPKVPTIARNISPRTEQTLATEGVQSGRKRVDELVKAAASAGAAKQAANTMTALLPNMGYTGVGGNAVAFADKALSGIGFPDVIAGKPAARETFQTQGVDAWVKAVEPLKGALTEREGARFDLAVSNLTTTPEGIRLRARLTDALAKRAQEKSQFYQAYLSENATLDGADAIWEQYSNENPVITDELLGVAGSSSAITAAPRNAADRKAGAIYSTPSGNLKWTGTGWLPAN